MAALLESKSDTSDSDDDVEYLPCESKEQASENESEESDAEPRHSGAEPETKKGEVSEEREAVADLLSYGKKLTAEEERKHAEELWKDFLGDVRPVVRRVETPDTTTKESDPVEKAEDSEEYHFAGEKVVVKKDGTSESEELVSSTSVEMKGETSKPPPSTKKRGGDLASIVGTLGKKKQLSTLEKSELDWKKFKKDEGIEEELKSHNKGKGGYMERQEFLQRAESRQFEIEKNVRLSRKAKK